MSAKKNNAFLKLYFPRIPVHKKVGDYYFSKKEVQQTILPVPGLDNARAHPDIDLVKARREYDETQFALEEKKKFFRKERERLNQEWENIQKNEEDLQANFVSISPFVQSNQIKRNRAIERKTEDALHVQQREALIKHRQEKLIFLQQIKKEIDKEAQSHQIFENYLNTVVEDSNAEFKSAQHIVDRYESLVQTRTELGERQNVAFLELEEAKKKMAKFGDEMSFRLVGLTNILAASQQRYQSALMNASHWERIIWTIKSDAFKRFREIMEIKQSCKNVYAMMCARKGEVPKIPEHDVEKQLFYIKRTLRQLATVRAESVAARKKIFSSMKVETSKKS